MSDAEMTPERDAKRGMSELTPELLAELRHQLVELRRLEREHVVDTAIHEALSELSGLLSLHGYDAWALHEGVKRRVLAKLEATEGGDDRHD